MNEQQLQRIREATERAAESVERCYKLAGEARAEWKGPDVGMAFLLPYRDLPHYWLVLDAHPDGPDLLRVVPVTDFPFAGECDLRCGDGVHVAHCNLSEWAPASEFTADRLAWVGAEWLELAGECRRLLAVMVRGRQWVVTTEQRGTQLDPAYTDHIAELESEIQLRKRAE